MISAKKILKTALTLCFSSFLLVITTVNSHAASYTISLALEGTTIREGDTLTYDGAEQIWIFFYDEDGVNQISEKEHGGPSCNVNFTDSQVISGMESEKARLLGIVAGWCVKTVDINGTTEKLEVSAVVREPGSVSSVKAPGHVHNFVWGTIIEPTMEHDGLEGEACACGATRNTQVISAYEYAIEQYAYNKVADTGAGNTCVLEMGTMDTYPKHFMEKIAPSVLRGVTVELRFKSNQKLTKIQIPGGSVVDTSCDWYGVNKLKELYTVVQ